MTEKIGNAYYFDESILNTACKDAKAGKPKDGCNSAMALFWSFFLRKKFDKEYGFVPSEILSAVKTGEHGDTFTKEELISESVCEDSTSIKTGKVNPVLALLKCANLKATECAGKVHLVTADSPEGVSFYQMLVKRFKLPLEVITDTQAVKDLKEIHDFLKQEQEKLISKK
jgi:hypothetical protein